MTSHRLSFCYGLIIALLLQGLIHRYGPALFRLAMQHHGSASKSGLVRSRQRMDNDSCAFLESSEFNLDECQIANSLTEQSGHKTFQISGFWADYRQFGSYPVVP